MPIIKSAKKRMRQNAVRRARNFAMRRKLREGIKMFMELIKNDKKDEAKTAFAGLQKVIDTASKKKIIHGNNAARKKAKYAKMLV